MKLEKIIFEDINNFELKDTFLCGQCFRWQEEKNGSYTGITKIGVLNVKKNEKEVIVCGYIKEDFSLKDFCKEYFDFEKDYKKVQSVISKDDNVMKEAIKFGDGIRILNQDSFEMLISFIISAANNIPRISKCINNISKMYGEKIIIPRDVCKEMFEEAEDREYYLFPSPENLEKAKLEDLRACNLGFRDKFVLDASKKVASGEVELKIIQSLNYEDAKKQLVNLDGVGEKVADCILLFAMKKSEAFPVDTWIKKIMNEIYVDSKNAKKIGVYARNKWGKNAGIAQQYLFYFKRENPSSK